MGDPEKVASTEDNHTNGAQLDLSPTNPDSIRDPDDSVLSPVMPAPVPAPAPPPQPTTGGLSPDATKAMDDVLYSDVGVTALITRLKQSIATARDLSGFLKKRSSLEDDHSKELRRLCRTTAENVKSRESRQGSYATQFEEVVRIHDRMAENEVAFGLNLHQMSMDLETLAHDIERGRKQLKTTGLTAEQRVGDAERALDKAKQKYDSLAEDYDHAKSGDKVSGRHIGFRPKSGAALEEDLQRKLTIADQDYQAKVQNAQQLRQELVTTSRPQTVQALMQLIKECDSGVTLQLQKFVAFNEKLLLGNGLLISPLNDGDSSRKSLRELVGQIDNDRDLHSYVTSHQVPALRENKYEKHPTQVPPPPKPMPQVQPKYESSPVQALPKRDSLPQQPQQQQQQPPPQFPMGPQGPSLPPQNFGSFDPLNERPHQQQAPYPMDNQPPQGPPGRGYPHPSNAPYGPGPGSGPNQYGQPGPYNQRPMHAHGPSGPGAMGPGAMGPGPIGPGPMGPGPVGSPMSQRPGSRTQQHYPPVRPVFGLHLNDLFVRDQSPVPSVVYQCIQAVEQFGLDSEGIYRVSGNANQLQQLRAQFDNNAASVDFRVPDAFFHDVNNPANLLKMFLRELPDPLLPKQSYQDFMDAAAIPDDVHRRDRLHATINDLPDPNYATLRAVTLHLHRVVQNFERNRMNPTNLAVIFAPTLMGAVTGPVQDSSLQHRAIETILINSLQIFDED